MNISAYPTAPATLTGGEVLPPGERRVGQWFGSSERRDRKVSMRHPRLMAMVNQFNGLWACGFLLGGTPRLRGLCMAMPVAAVAYHVILEPGIGQFREFEPRRVHTRINSLGLFLVHK